MNAPFAAIEPLSKYFGVSVSTLRQWVRDNKIPDTCYIKVGLTYRFHVKATQDALMNYKHREGLTDEERAKIASDIIDGTDTGIADESPTRAKKENVQAAEAELESKVHNVPNLQADPELDDELAGIFDEHDLKDL